MPWTTKIYKPFTQDEEQEFWVAEFNWINPDKHDHVDFSHKNAIEVRGNTKKILDKRMKAIQFAIGLLQ